jgi:hypothetical protein
MATVDPVARTLTLNDGRVLTFTEAEWAEAHPPKAEVDAWNAAVAAPQAEAERVRGLLDAATVAIREWAMDTQAWLYTGGASGTFDAAGFLALVQQAETAGLAYNALPAEYLTPALIQEQAGMALRGQQAQILYGMARDAVPA